MIKVCHLTNVHARYDGRVLKECSSLAEAGYEVSLVVNDDKEDETVDGVTICSTKKVWNSRLHRITMLKSVFKKALEINADIYHLHDPELLLLASKLKKRGKLVVFDSHEDYKTQIMIKDYIPVLLRKLVSNIYYNYETWVCKRIDAVIFIAPILVDGEEIEPFKNRCRRLCYIANYPKKIFELSIEKASKKEFKVCHVGSLTHERGITALIDACYAAHCKLVLAGDFSSKEYWEMLQAKESYQCVDYRGHCGKSEVYNIYNECAVGAATLLNIGQYGQASTFATKVFEYFQMRLPVLITAYPYAIKMNDTYHFGIVVRPDDPKEIAAAIIKLRTDPDFCKSMGENGFTLYKEKFNWELEREKLYSLYAELSNSVK